jgi:hypothetical protein
MIIKNELIAQLRGNTSLSTWVYSDTLQNASGCTPVYV